MTIRINIHAIKYNKADVLRGRLETDLVALSLVQPPDVTWEEPIIIEYEVVNAGSVYVFEANVRLQMTFACSRCLGETSQVRDLKLSEEYVRTESGQIADTLTQDEIDVTELIHDSILLSVPMQPLCKQDCAGLCPQCGVDINHIQCECNPETVDPRLAVLQKLLK